MKIKWLQIEARRWVRLKSKFNLAKDVDKSKQKYYISENSKSSDNLLSLNVIRANSNQILKSKLRSILSVKKHEVLPTKGR